MHRNIATLFTELGGCLVIQRAVRPPVVVELTPGFNCGPRIALVSKPLPIHALITQLAIESLPETVVPWFARRYVAELAFIRGPR